jgi:hypothetical protein
LKHRIGIVRRCFRWKSALLKFRPLHDPALRPMSL